ncbi:hypothetical protein SAMN05660206_10670 [Sphingobacterium wenxiniae]|uniref:Uncharacterized protein n=1 Tax=Sphingobacterium wenxiniae TaxID=683125 RepID=A0A1I6TD06_9SPHI|nr:hypothetical protein SAMN05660206_10670 [Sphingobacterium wenxiniae]
MGIIDIIIVICLLVGAMTTKIKILKIRNDCLSYPLYLIWSVY